MQDLRELLTSHGRTIRQAGIDQAYCVQLIHGRHRVGANAVAKIAAALGVEAPVVYAACQESVRRASSAQRPTRGQGASSAKQVGKPKLRG